MCRFYVKKLMVMAVFLRPGAAVGGVARRGGRGSAQAQARHLGRAEAAVRGLLYLYWELATNWGGINGEAEFGGFDRWRWLQCEADYDGGVWRSFDDTLLLRQGSAVALLCEMNNEWDHYDEVEEQVWRVALEAGRFDHLPEARRAVEAGLKGEKQLYEELPVVYDGYVLAFFEMLVREGGPPTFDPSTFDPAAFLSGMVAEERPRSSFRDPREQAM